MSSVEYNVLAFTFNSASICLIFGHYVSEIVLFYKGWNTTGRVRIKIEQSNFLCTVVVFICPKLTYNNVTESDRIRCWQCKLELIKMADVSVTRFPIRWIFKDVQEECGRGM
jgi:hypothetical protein